MPLAASPPANSIINWVACLRAGTVSPGWIPLSKRMEASLVRDLGGESIDFLDIVFRLEKSFGIKIARGELFLEDVINNEENVQDGLLTESGLNALEQKIPYASLDEFKKNPSVKELANLFTVRMMVDYISQKVN